MEGPCLHPPHSNHCFLFFVFTISISYLATSSRACPEFICGDYVFQYPFGEKKSGCGDPVLQLECDHQANMPLINIGGHQYYILHPKEDELGRSENLLQGNYNYNLTLIDGNLLGPKCNPSSSIYIAQIWSSTQFHVTGQYKNLTLWEQCNETEVNFKDIASPLPCNGSWFYISKPRSSLTLDALCKSQVKLPVESVETPVREEILHKGFQIQLNISENCKDCLLEKGLCSYYTDSMHFCCNCRETGCRNKCSAGKSPAKHIILGCSIGGVVLIAVLLLFVYYVRRRKASPNRGFTSNFSPDQGTDIEEGQKGYMEGPLRIFSYQELQQATNFFDEKNELGDGGFGAVYLGKLEDGRTVAVKRLYQENSRRFEQFINEVQILSSLYHPNLVRLYGCTSAESPILLLVYEYVSNGTLADHLHGSRRNPRGLPWETRIKIALQTAQALAYLHSIDPPIFHRDVKSNNILVDEYFETKVADFGLSRLMPVNVTHVTTAPQGTPGYVDPEYHECFQLTEKSDVYSFGVVLVEIISAKVAVDIMRNRNEISLAIMFIDKIRRGVLDELVDPDLKIEKNHEVKAMVAAVAKLAFECLAGERDLRPYMKEVVARLEQIKEMQQQSIESSKLTSISPMASPLSAPIMGSERSGPYWAPLSL